MTEFDRRAVIRFLGLGCAVTPIIAAEASSLQGAAQGADPEVDTLLREAARHVLRIKNNVARGHSGPNSSDLHMVAGHLRLLDAMAETRGWKRRLLVTRIPQAAELDQVTRGVSAALAERLTAEGLPMHGHEVETLYWKYRDRFSERGEAQLHQSLHSGTFLAEHASLFDAMAEMLENNEGAASPVGHIGQLRRGWAGRVVRPVAAQPDVVSTCEGLRNLAAMCTLCALCFAFIPPLEGLAVAYEIGALLCDIAMMIIC
jgi:hypothetical protein